MKNHITVTFDAISVNEAFARMVVSAFLAGGNATVEDITDVKTAVSEAVTNAIIHGYEEKKGSVTMTCAMEGPGLVIYIQDYGKGIADVHKAREPFYTTKPELERSGLGFAFMETFMDGVEVISGVGQGTTVIMKKILKDDHEYATA